MPLASAPVQGLKFVWHADNEWQGVEQLMSAMQAADKQSKAHESQLMKPSLHAMTGQPDMVSGLLKKLEGSYRDPATASYFARKVAGAHGRPRCL